MEKLKLTENECRENISAVSLGGIQMIRIFMHCEIQMLDQD